MTGSKNAIVVPFMTTFYGFTAFILFIVAMIFVREFYGHSWQWSKKVKPRRTKAISDSTMNSNGNSTPTPQRMDDHRCNSGGTVASDPRHTVTTAAMSTSNDKSTNKILNNNNSRNHNPNANNRHNRSGDSRNDAPTVDNPALSFPRELKLSTLTCLFSYVIYYLGFFAYFQIFGHTFPYLPVMFVICKIFLYNFLLVRLNLFFANSIFAYPRWMYKMFGAMVAFCLTMFIVALIFAVYDFYLITAILYSLLTIIDTFFACFILVLFIRPLFVLVTTRRRSMAVSPRTLSGDKKLSFSDSQEQFLTAITRYATLNTQIIITDFMVQIFCGLYILYSHNLEMKLCMVLIVVGDHLSNVLNIYMMFTFGTPLYSKLCCLCDRCCGGIAECYATQHLLRQMRGLQLEEYNPETDITNNVVNIVNVADTDNDVVIAAPPMPVALNVTVAVK